MEKQKQEKEKIISQSMKGVANMCKFKVNDTVKIIAKPEKMQGYEERIGTIGKIVGVDDDEISSFVYEVEFIDGVNLMFREGELELFVSSTPTSLNIKKEKKTMAQEAQVTMIQAQMTDVVKVTLNQKVVVVELEDGTRGRAKCSPNDTFDAKKGFDIAFLRAKVKALQKTINKLTN
jgi:hypothetical protein